MMTRRKFSTEFKVKAVRRLGAGQTAAEVARALEVHPTELYRWRREVEEHGERAFQAVGRKRAEESRMAELERKIGQQTREIDFLGRAWQQVEEPGRLRVLEGGAASTNQSRKRSAVAPGGPGSGCASWPRQATPALPHHPRSPATARKSGA